jgi:hypothetical protein
MMDDHDSKSTLPTHTTGTRQGEDIKDADGKESGREEGETTHAERPSGGSTARDSTAINPDSVESDSDMPDMPPA